MTTKITKLSVLAFLGLGLVAYGQSGKVGINTSLPSATLEVQPSALNLGKDATTNEGFIAPKLSKTRIATIASPVEGTLVYATDEDESKISAYTGDNTKVAKITERGYYYYNGTEWVKSGASPNGELWAQRDNNGVTETYLKPANENNDYLAYTGNRRYELNLGGVTDADGIVSPFLGKEDLTTYKRGVTPFAVAISSDVLSSKEHLPTYLNFNNLLRENGVASRAGAYTYYTGSTFSFSSRDVTSDLNGGLTSLASHTNILSTGKVKRVTGTVSLVNVGGGSKNANISEYANALYTSVVTNSGSFIELSRGISSNVTNYEGAVVNHIRGITSAASTQSLSSSSGITTHPAHAIKTMYGIDNAVSVSENATVETGTNGIRSASYFRENSTNPVHYGIFNYNRTYAGANVDKLYGARYFFVNDTAATIGEMYGLYVDNINKGSKLNYSIYTNEGAVRFGELKGSGNRPVYADADGKLIIGDATNALTSFKWIEDTTNNSVKLAVNSAGIERTQYPVSITDEGIILGSSFRGANGATIFPDYVFQKYYTGISNIKADYNFKTLSQVEDFVKTNGHLPGYQSAEAIKKQGYIDLMATQLTNVEKIEELYLHSIEQDKALKAKDAKIVELEARLQKLEALLVK
ncbi:hypothetical protein JSO54_05735 [Riemerella anatipestifer]|uniref:hypothetical protein n=1 Tax=Riemerella anatipestifer TaxID=34085 RepID=UPI0030C12CCD